MGDRGSFGDRSSSGRDKSDKSGFQSMPGATGDSSSKQNEEGASNASIIPTSSTIPDMSGSFDPSNLPEGFDPSQIPGGAGGQMPNMGELPEGFDPSQMPGDFGGMFPGGSSDGTETTPSDNLGNTDSTDNSNRPSRDNMQIPGGNWGSNTNGMGTTTSSGTNWIWLVASVLILGVGLLIAKLYKRY